LGHCAFGHDPGLSTSSVKHVERLKRFHVAPAGGPPPRRRVEPAHKTQPPGRTDPFRARSATHATNPPARNVCSGGAPRCVPPVKPEASCKPSRIRSATDRTTRRRHLDRQRTPAQGLQDLCRGGGVRLSVRRNRGRPRAPVSDNTRSPRPSIDSDGPATHHLRPPQSAHELRRHNRHRNYSRPAGDNQRGGHASQMRRSVQTKSASDGRRQTAAACPSWSGPAGRAGPAPGSQRPPTRILDRVICARSDATTRRPPNHPRIAAVYCTARRVLRRARPGQRLIRFSTRSAHVVSFLPRGPRNS